MNMTVCFFGSYNRDYPRNQILLNGLKKNGVVVFDCHSTKGFFLQRYTQLTQKFLPLRKKVDVIFVAFPGHLDMPLAWLLGKLTGTKVVFDVFYSLYDTYVNDRQSTKPRSAHAILYLLIDKLSMRLADLIISDTWSHAKYLSETFGIPASKFKRVFLGADDRIFKKTAGKNGQNENVVVEFHGMFARLQGVEYFIEAAKKLENNVGIKFILIGGENNYSYPLELMKRLKPKNLDYLGRLSPKQLNTQLQLADISIGGHLGMTNKASNVIANKTFESLAMGKALIVGDTVANRELLEDKKNAIFVKPGSADDLKKKILYLSREKKLRQKIALSGNTLFKNQLTNYHVAKTLLSLFTHLLNES